MRKALALIVAALVMAGCGGGLGTVLDTLLRINHAARVANLVDVYIFRRDQNIADDLISALPITSRLAPGDSVDDIELPPGDYRIVFTETGTKDPMIMEDLTIQTGMETEATLAGEQNQLEVKVAMDVKS
ncbi:MAG: hypothetical protein ACOCX1_01865 [Fimbriimonadaceae bacterium]